MTTTNSAIDEDEILRANEQKSLTEQALRKLSMMAVSNSDLNINEDSNDDNYDNNYYNTTKVQNSFVTKNEGENSTLFEVDAKDTDNNNNAIYESPHYDSAQKVNNDSSSSTTANTQKSIGEADNNDVKSQGNNINKEASGNDPDEVNNPGNPSTVDHNDGSDEGNTQENNSYSTNHNTNDSNNSNNNNAGHINSDSNNNNSGRNNSLNNATSEINEEDNSQSNNYHNIPSQTDNHSNTDTDIDRQNPSFISLSHQFIRSSSVKSSNKTHSSQNSNGSNNSNQQQNQQRQRNYSSNSNSNSGASSDSSRSKSRISPLDEKVDVTKSRNYISYVESSELIPSNNGSTNSSNNNYNDINFNQATSNSSNMKHNGSNLSNGHNNNGSAANIAQQNSKQNIINGHDVALKNGPPIAPILDFKTSQGHVHQQPSQLHVQQQQQFALNSRNRAPHPAQLQQQQQFLAQHPQHYPFQHQNTQQQLPQHSQQYQAQQISSHYPQGYGRGSVDPSSVNIFSNQDIINNKLKMQKQKAHPNNKHHSAGSITTVHNKHSQDQPDTREGEEDLPEGIGRPLYVPAVIRKTEETIDLQEYYMNLKEKQKRQQQLKLLQQAQQQQQQQQQKKGSKASSLSSSPNSISGNINESLNGGTSSNLEANTNNSSSINRHGLENKAFSASNGSIINYFFNSCSPNNSSGSSPAPSHQPKQYNSNDQQQPSKQHKQRLRNLTNGSVRQVSNGNALSKSDNSNRNSNGNGNGTISSISSSFNNFVGNYYFNRQNDSSTTGPAAAIGIKNPTVSGSSTSLQSFFSPGKKTAVSTAHWKPDSSARKCHNCQREFNLLNRKHHCRKCGEIFCDNCLKYTVKLDFYINFKIFNESDFISSGVKLSHRDEIGIDCKSCYGCYKKYKYYLQEKLTELANCDEEITCSKASSASLIADPDATVLKNEPYGELSSGAAVSRNNNNANIANNNNHNHNNNNNGGGTKFEQASDRKSLATNNRGDKGPSGVIPNAYRRPSVYNRTGQEANNDFDTEDDGYDWSTF